MCWIGKLELKTAEKDIPIYKIMQQEGEILYSFYRNYKYSLNKEVQSEIIFNDKIIIFEKYKPEGYYIVRKALHSYSSSVMTSIYIEHLNTIISKKIVKVRGIIPKGSQYCQNYKGEYISDRLILQKIEKEL